MNKMKIKVCGMRDGENISQVAALGVDWIGMVFCERSPRNVTMIPTHAGIIPDRPSIEGTDSVTSPLKTPCRVGVFVDEMAQNIITRVVNFRLGAVQLHGQESPTFIRNLRATLTPGLQIWKAISIAPEGDEATTSINDRCRPYEDCCDLLVFDTKCPTDGGSGQHFDWSLLNAYDGRLPFLLSGGIGPDDIEALRAFSHPRCIGIDLNSRFETAPAIKDVERLRLFIQQLRNQ